MGIELERSYYTAPTPPAEADVNSFASSYGKELAIAKFALQFFEQLETVYRLGNSIVEMESASVTLRELGYGEVLSDYTVNAGIVALRRLRDGHENHLGQFEHAFLEALNAPGKCALEINTSLWGSRTITGWSESARAFMRQRYSASWDRCESWLAISGDPTETVCENNPGASILVPFYGGTDVMPLEMWRSLWRFIQDCKVTNWKEKLQEGWEKATFSGNLQAIRNRPGCGPTWLANLTENQIKLSIHLLEEHEACED
jgi:hypothetical protein